MDKIKALFVDVCKQYNKLQSHYDASFQLVVACHTKLFAETKYELFGHYQGKPVIPYNCFSGDLENPNSFSRPVRPDIFISKNADLLEKHAAFIKILGQSRSSWSAAEIELANQIVYTAVLSISCCYDLWQRGSRKTPGTFFEVFMAGVLQKMLPSATFAKSIPLANLLADEDVKPEGEDAKQEDETAGVATDLVVGLKDHVGGVVIPLKITTRERIVQPFAHQRILDSAFKDGRFKSLLVCMSETQLDEKAKAVKQVTVPGTVKLFQKYLAKLDGIYYCDIPQRYGAEDMQKTIPVKSVGHFFADVDNLLAAHGARKK